MKQISRTNNKLAPSELDRTRAGTPARFWIAGTQRTGTTLLRTSLNSHPDIVCHGEVFKLGRSPYRLPGGYWEYTRQTATRRIESIFAPDRSIRGYVSQLYDRNDCGAIGFKLMLNQCDQRKSLWPSVMQTGARVILMSRRNALKTLVSRHAAASSRVYHVSPTLPAKTAVAEWTAEPVVIEPSGLLRRIEEIAAETERWKQRLQGVDYMELVYEDYVADSVPWNTLLQKFVGVDPRPLTSDLEKVNPDDLRKVIRNFDEVADALRHSQFARFLDS